MDCERVQNEIIEFLGASPSATTGQDIDRHLAGCPACAEFAARHNNLDQRLTAMLVPPELSPKFRSGLRKQMRRHTIGLWRDPLPDIVHFASCGMATLVCAVLLPFDAVAIIVAGTAAALLAYVPLTMIRSSFEPG